VHHQRAYSANSAFASLPPDSDGGGSKGTTNLVNSAYQTSKIVNTLKKLSLENEPWGRNPFLTPAEELSLQTRYRKGDKDKESEATTINGILIGQNQRIAIIDHTIVTEGDWIGSEQVVKIDKNKAILAIGKNRRSVVMDVPSIAISVEESIDREEKDEL